MSEPEAEIRIPQPDTEVESRNQRSISPWKVAVAVMMAGIVIFIGFILLRLVLPTNWGFTVEATTEVVEVKLRPGTEARWLVDGATVCSRVARKSPENHVAKLPDSPCDGSNWIGWRSRTRITSRYCD